MSKITSKNLVDYIIDYESGNLGDKDTLNFFAYLIKTGQAWSLQGHYGRTAKALIDDGFITSKGFLTKKAKEKMQYIL